VATTSSTWVTLTLHCWAMAWMLTLFPYWLTCTLPTCACIAVWTQAALPLPTCVTCARAGTAAANTMASIAANNITFFKSTS
jgi:hypothetical protein